MKGERFIAANLVLGYHTEKRRKAAPMEVLEPCVPGFSSHFSFSRLSRMFTWKWRLSGSFTLLLCYANTKCEKKTNTKECHGFFISINEKKKTLAVFRPILSLARHFRKLLAVFLTGKSLATEGHCELSHWKIHGSMGDSFFVRSNMSSDGGEQVEDTRVQLRRHSSGISFSSGCPSRNLSEMP